MRTDDAVLDGSNKCNGFNNSNGYRRAIVHGTAKGYKDGCRCEMCKKANNSLSRVRYMLGNPGNYGKTFSGNVSVEADFSGSAIEKKLIGIPPERIAEALAKVAKLYEKKLKTAIAWELCMSGII